MWEYQALTENVHDGDTVRFLIDQGMYERTSQMIRFIGVFAPELDKPGGPEARDFVSRWLGNHKHGAEWPVIITTKKNAQSFTRYLGMVKCATCGVSLNEAVNTFLKENMLGKWRTTR